jgi:hypothetical protein
MSNTNIINYDGFKTVGTSTQVISVTELEVGKVYTIASVGDTDFIAIGAANGTLNEQFTATDVGSGTGTIELVDESGIILSDNFNTWRKKTNGILEKVNAMDVDLLNLTSNAALLDKTDIQNFTSAIGGEFKDYATMSAANRTIDLKEANIFKFKLQGDFTLLLSNLAVSVGCSYTLIVESEGAYQITWPTAFKFADGNGTLTKTGSSGTPSYDILRFESDGTNLYCTISSYVDNAIETAQAGAATTHFVDAYGVGQTAVNGAPSGPQIAAAQLLLGDTVKPGHFVMARFNQRYSYGTGNGTGYSNRQILYVYEVTGTYPTQNWQNRTSAFL